MSEHPTPDATAMNTEAAPTRSPTQILKLMAHQCVTLPRTMLGTRDGFETWAFSSHRRAAPNVPEKAAPHLPIPSALDEMPAADAAATAAATPAAVAADTASLAPSEKGSGHDKHSREKPVNTGLPEPRRGARKTVGALDIYISHFGLTERPFSLVPDPDFLFWSPAHQRAYTMLEYGILTRAPITLITGEVGAGKTTLVHHLLKSLGDEVKVGMISNAHGSRGELLRWVLMSLDQPAAPEATYVDLFAAFQAFLIAEYAAGRRVILIFDEAQNLSRESLEELRMFTNINANKDELLQLVLVGQPELRDTIHRPDLRQFAQRVAANFHLTAMDAKTVRNYIRHRLLVAGASRNFFSQAATNLVYEATRGVPRLVNQLCDLSMVYAFTKGPTSIMRTTVQQVLDDGVFFGAQSFPSDTASDPGKDQSR